jgi:hypothetical protein
MARLAGISTPGTQRVQPFLYFLANVELRELVSDPTLEYCRKFFHFALLEYRPTSTPDDAILEREGFWKRILLTRGEYGLNRN